MYVQIKQETKQRTEPEFNSPNKYMIGGQFDIATFNADFLKVIDEQEIIAENIENKKLKQINDYYIKKEKYSYDAVNNLSDLTISQLLLDWLSNIRDIFIELFQFNYSLDDFFYIFTKKNRLFYIGLTFVFVSLVSYLFQNFIINKSSIKLKPNEITPLTVSTSSTPSTSSTSSTPSLTVSNKTTPSTPSTPSLTVSNKTTPSTPLTVPNEITAKTVPDKTGTLNPKSTKLVEPLMEPKSGGEILSSPLIYGLNIFD